MASDRNPLTQRFKSLTSRQRDTPPAATAIPAEQPTVDAPALAPSDDQPTTEHLALAGEHETAEHQAVAAPDPIVEVPAASMEWPQRTPTPEFPPAPGSPEPAPAAATDVPQPEASPAPIQAEAAHTAQAQPVATPDLAATPVEAPTEEAATDRSLSSRLTGRLRRPRPDSTEIADPATVPAQPVVAAAPADAVAATVEPSRPSFGERAALRRRAKTLRARRDAGLLELGAIVLDQRRFGDPTEGSLVRRRTDELADLDSELAAIEQVLDDDGPAETVAQLGVIRCLDCSTLIGARDQFCVACGAPRPVGEAAPPAPGA